MQLEECGVVGEALWEIGRTHGVLPDRECGKAHSEHLRLQLEEAVEHPQPAEEPPEVAHTKQVAASGAGSL